MFAFLRNFLPDINATFVLVIITRGAGGTWQLDPNYNSMLTNETSG